MKRVAIRKSDACGFQIFKRFAATTTSTITLPGVLRVETPQDEAQRLPVMFDSPHSGMDWPPSFQPLCTPMEVRMGEDSYMDTLFHRAPAQQGITLLAALFPRAFLDANRAADDIDPAQIEGVWPGELRPSDKSKNGLGLIRQFIVPGLRVQGKLPVSEVKARVEGYWQPYHSTLQHHLDLLHSRYGFLYHIDWHSMKSVGNGMTPDGAKERPDFVLGNRHGKTCSNELMNKVAGWLRDMGYSVQLNDPYVGAYIVNAYGRPDEGRHSLQIEVKRALYMDEATREKHDGYYTLENNMNSLVDRLVAEAKKKM